MRTFPEALRVPLDDSHSLLITEAGRDPRAGLAAVVFLGCGTETLGFGRVLLALPESRTSLAESWATLNGTPAAAIERALVGAAAQVEVRLRELEREAQEAKRKTKAETKSEAAPKGRALEFTDPEPWPEPVEGAVLLEQMAEVFNRFLVLPHHGAELLTLWVVHTWVFEQFDHVAYVSVNGPERRCGKTSVKRVARAFAHRPISAESVSPAALFRLIEAYQPTLMIDELDRLPADSDIWGVLNSGHERDGAVLRTAGDDHEPRAFSTFGPKLLCYIRRGRPKVPDTVEDRCIQLSMQRKAPGERREKLRSRLLEQIAEPIRRRLVRWTQDTAFNSAPDAPEALNDRQADSWEPLLSVADAAGGRWPALARLMAVAFSSDRDEDEGEIGSVLLSDLIDLMDSGRVSADEGWLSGEEACRELALLTDRPWSRWGRSEKAITTKALSVLLKAYDVRPERVGGRQDRSRRYAAEKVRAAWSRYRVDASDQSAHTSTDPEQTTVTTVGSTPWTRGRIEGPFPGVDASERVQTARQHECEFHAEAANPACLRCGALGAGA
jgi:hypothetical protein